MKLVIYDLIKTLYERIINLINIWTKLEKAFMFILLLLLHVDIWVKEYAAVSRNETKKLWEANSRS